MFLSNTIRKTLNRTLVASLVLVQVACIRHSHGGREFDDHGSPAGSFHTHFAGLGHHDQTPHLASHEAVHASHSYRNLAERPSPSLKLPGECLEAAAVDFWYQRAFVEHEQAPDAASVDFAHQPISIVVFEDEHGFVVDSPPQRLETCPIYLRYLVILC